MNIVNKNWLIPTIAFFFFLYAMALLGIYTFRDSQDALFEGAKNLGPTSVKDLQKEIGKRGISR
ncbi:hypothetical protein ACWIWK_01040 [Helicobacter sp. 23-1048]